MTKEEILKKIEEIEYQKDILSFKDRWSDADYETNRKWYNELATLKSMLKLWEMRD